MVVHKPLMIQFLEELQPRLSNDTSWVAHVLENLPEDELFTGFSEYASYISWVKQQHPEQQHILARKTWVRTPLGGWLGMWLASASQAEGLCCPTSWLHRLQYVAGLQYYGFELGHHKFCRFRAVSQHRGVYGLR
jgi:hypothetical protein